MGDCCLKCPLVRSAGLWADCSRTETRAGDIVDVFVGLAFEPVRRKHSPWQAGKPAPRTGCSQALSKVSFLFRRGCCIVFDSHAVTTITMTKTTTKTSRNPAEYPILGVLSRGPIHGYDINRVLVTESGRFGVWAKARSMLCS